MENLIPTMIALTTAIAPIIAAIIMKPNKTENDAAVMDELKPVANDTVDNRRTSSSPKPIDTFGKSRIIGLFCMLFASSHLAFLQFAQGHEAALSVGSAATIAQAFGLLLMGVWLLFER